MNIYLLPMVILSAVHLYSCTKEITTFRKITKGLLMPTLMVFYILTATHINWLIIAALVFGTLGDVFLLPFEKVDLFVPGVLSFALGHIFYSVALFRESSLKTANYTYFAVGIALLLIFSILLYKKILPFLDKNMRIVILGYLLVIMIMGASALLFFSTAITSRSIIALIGAALFILSDSILAFQLFKKETITGYFIVMLLYISAQIALVYSFTI